MFNIYRFMSFESFVDTILKKQLTFVHPSLWEDPYELYHLNEHILKNLKNSSGVKEQVLSLLQYLITKKLYCQAWTSLSESDALWRVYSHNKTSVRIAVEESKIDLLDDVKKIKVEYTDDFNEMYLNDDNIYELLKLKRKAFAHEQEIRLVKHYKFLSTEDAIDKIKGLLTLLGKNKKFFEKVELEQINEEADKLISSLNFNLQQSTMSVSFSHIDNFIESVMLNPFAPDWFDDTLRLFCNKHNIKYIGKSKLYEK